MYACSRSGNWLTYCSCHVRAESKTVLRAWCAAGCDCAHDPACAFNSTTVPYSGAPTPRGETIAAQAQDSEPSCLCSELQSRSISHLAAPVSLMLTDSGLSLKVRLCAGSTYVVTWVCAQASLKAGRGDCSSAQHFWSVRVPQVGRSASKCSIQPESAADSLCGLTLALWMTTWLFVIGFAHF